MTVASSRYQCPAANWTKDRGLASKRIKKKSEGRTRLKGPRYWVALGTLTAYTAATRGEAAPTQPPLTNNVAEAPPQVDPSKALSVHSFNIPPQDLGTVLAAFENATGVHVQVTEEGIRTLPSPGVSGLYTVQQGLQFLLGGTGVSYRFVAPDTVILQLRGISTSVNVNAAASQVTPAKYPEPLLNTPQSIDVVPQQVLSDQGVTTLRDALRNFAGISLAAGEGGSQGDNLTIRGFTARNDLFLDGMRDFGSYYRDPFNLEQVEVLQGPSSVTFGRGSTGGVVNQVTKTPQLDRFVSGGLQFGTDATRRVTADFNAPPSMLGAGAAFRLNLMGDIGGVAERNIAENRRFGVAPTIAFGLGTPTRLTLSYFHQTEDDSPDYGVPWYFNGPAPVNRAAYFGLKDGNYLRTYDDIGTATVEHDFGSAITLRNQVRFSNAVRDALITEPQVPSDVTLATPLDLIEVNREQIGVRSNETSLDEQLDVTFRFKTGFIRHTLVTGLEGVREASNPTRPTYPESSVPTTSLLHPDPYQMLTGGAPITSRVQTTGVTFGAYALDSLRLGEKWQITAGMRYDRMSTDYSQSIAPAFAFSRTDDMPSWRAALSYAPKPNGSIYFAASDSFNPSTETLSLSAANANLPPEKNLSYEAGTKWDFAARRLSMRSRVVSNGKNEYSRARSEQPFTERTSRQSAGRRNRSERVRPFNRPMASTRGVRLAG